MDRRHGEARQFRVAQSMLLSALLAVSVVVLAVMTVPTFSHTSPLHLTAIGSVAHGTKRLSCSQNGSVGPMQYCLSLELSRSRSRVQTDVGRPAQVGGGAASLTGVTPTATSSIGATSPVGAALGHKYAIQAGRTSCCVHFTQETMNM